MSDDERFIELLTAWSEATPDDRPNAATAILNYLASTPRLPAKAQAALNQLNELAPKVKDLERKAESLTKAIERDEPRARQLAKETARLVSEKQVAQSEAEEARKDREAATAEFGRLRSEILKLRGQLERLTADRAARLIQGEEILEAIRASRQ